MNKTNPPIFAMNRDMKNIYRSLYEKFPEGFPEILVYDDLSEPLMSHFIQQKKDPLLILHVKNDTDDRIIDIISKELNSHRFECPAPFPYFDHDLSNQDVAKWCVYACYIADILDIPLKQLMFFHTNEPSGYSDSFLPTLIDDKHNDVEMMIAIAHELRHAWQHLNQPELFDNYVRPEDDEAGYYKHPSEIDAEAFGIKIESEITGVNLMNSYAGQELEPEYRENLLKRISQIDVILPQKVLNKIRKLLDIDRLLKDAHGSTT